MRVPLLALLALGALPHASALDLLPDATRLGATEGLVVVRASGALRVASEGRVEVALGEGAFVRAPTELDIRGAPAWRGLEGAFEVRLRRASPTEEARVELDDGRTGVVVEWPAQRRVPGGGVAAGLVAAALARVMLARERRTFP